ncbi:MAG: hypothetical protein JW862_01300 [Anaerolineales bacterium]|nr:hypothetical protein [Anaerolineales bacterium]
MKRNLKLLLTIASLALMILACGLGGSSEPTATQPPPKPTETTAPEPTDIPEPTPEPVVIEEPTRAPVEEPVAAANEVSIVAINGYRDEWDSLRIVGLLTNNTSRVVDNIEIEIEVFDANGNSLYVETTYSELYTLAPGETSPFAMWVFEDLPEADTYVATIVGQGSGDVDRAFLDTAGVLVTVDDDGDVNITGTMVNNTGQSVQINSLAAATFDANGNLFTADGYSVAVRHLDPGEDGPFRITITSPEGGAADMAEYELYVDAEYTDESTFYPIDFTDISYYVDAYGYFHMVGEVTNNSDYNLSISLVGAIYDADGNIIDAASTDIPVYGLPPGATSAYDLSYWGPLNYQDGLLDSLGADLPWSVQWDPYWTWESFNEYILLSTANDVNEYNGWSGEFTGQVVNDSGGAVDGAIVVITLYDSATGAAIAMDYDPIFDEIPAGGTVDYTVYMDLPPDFDFNTVEYYIDVWGELP